MFYIVGLGNPGADRAKERHNVGWMILDDLVASCGLPSPVMSAKYTGRISEGVLSGQEVTLLYPETYMNNSGVAVRKLVSKGAEGKVILIYDDIDIPVGGMKISVGRGDGGHNGVKSVISSLGTKEFVRIRIGIAGKTFFGNTKRPVGAKLPAYVLSDFKKSELEVIDQVAQTVREILSVIMNEGVEKAMNRFN